MKAFLLTRVLLRGLIERLLPWYQREIASQFDHFRHISLCNFCYKIISKLLANRLRTVLGSLFSPHQSAFVNARWIAESSLLAQELVHTIKGKKGKKGLMAVKIDMNKAYDSPRIELHWGGSQLIVLTKLLQI